MHILITGGTGFIGSHLCHYFLRQKYQVSVLTRNPTQRSGLPDSIKLVGSLTNTTPPYDVIINLAGASLNKRRWNNKVKKILYESRIHTTQKVVEYIQSARVKPKLLISGSAIGFYGSSQNNNFIENSPPADGDFAHHLCDEWEKVAMKAEEYGTRVCCIRTGVVLGKEGGVLAVMLPTFRWGLGAQFGDGTQWMSWIHIDDVVGIIHYLITHTMLTGPINLTSPQPNTHRDFVHSLAKSLQRPCLIKLPSNLVKILFGEMGETLLLRGQKVLPDKITKAGYTFLFPQLEGALNNILHSSE